MIYWLIAWYLSGFILTGMLIYWGGSLLVEDIIIGLILALFGPIFPIAALFILHFDTIEGVIQDVMKKEIWKKRE